MSTEHFYWFIDRALVDPALGMSWSAFLRRYPWPERQLHALLTFSIEPEPAAADLAGILARRTLRWTMQRASPAYYFLNEIVHHVPRLQRGCPEVWGSLYENAVLTAVACDAFLDDRIDAKTTLAVHTITGSEDPRESLNLSRSEMARVERALRGSDERPIFPWLGVEAMEDGYSGLRSTDTKRFMAFLRRAWDENWPAPRINDEVMAALNRIDPKTPRFREFEMAKSLAHRAKAARFEKPCVLRYFG